MSGKKPSQKKDPESPKVIRFVATIEAGARGGAKVAVPFDVESTFGARGRVPVKVRFEEVSYRGSLAPMGGCHILGVRKDIRAALGKDIGDEISVTLERDTQRRSVRVPRDLRAALSTAPEAAAKFEELSYTHRREFVEWVTEAKRQETRKRRVAKAVEMVRQGATR